MKVEQIEVEALEEEMDLVVQSKDGACTGSCMYDCIVAKNKCDAQTLTWW